MNPTSPAVKIDSINKSSLGNHTSYETLSSTPQTLLVSKPHIETDLSSETLQFESNASTSSSSQLMHQTSNYPVLSDTRVKINWTHPQSVNQEFPKYHLNHSLDLIDTMALNCNPEDSLRYSSGSNKTISVFQKQDEIKEDEGPITNTIKTISIEMQGPKFRKNKLSLKDKSREKYPSIRPKPALVDQALSITSTKKSNTRVSKKKSAQKNTEKQSKSPNKNRIVSKNEAAAILGSLQVEVGPIECRRPLVRSELDKQSQTFIYPSSMQPPKVSLFADFSLPSHQFGSFAYHVARELYESNAEERLRFPNTAKRFDWKAYKKVQREAETYHKEIFELKNVTPIYHYQPFIDTTSKEYSQKREVMRLKKKQLDAKNKARNLAKARKIEEEQTELRNALKPKLDYWNSLSYPELVKEFNLLHQPKRSNLKAVNNHLSSASTHSIAKSLGERTASMSDELKVDYSNTPSALTQSISKPKVPSQSKSRATVTKKVKKPKVANTIVIPSVNTVHVPVTGTVAMSNGVPLQGLSRYSPYGTRFSATMPNGDIIESFISGDLKVRRENSLQLVLHAGEMQQLEAGLEFVKLNPNAGAAELLGCIRDLKLDINYRKGGEILLHKEAGNFFKRVQEYGAKKHIDPTFLSW